MTDLKKLEELFQALVDLPSEDRSAFLDAQDPAPALRRRVESMVDDWQRGGTPSRCAARWR